MSEVYVGNLDPKITASELHRQFEVFGNVYSVRIIGRPSTYAFISFEDRRDAWVAIHQLNGKYGWKVNLSHNSRRNGYGRSRGHSCGSGHRCYQCGEPGHFARECGLHGGGGAGRRYSRSPSYDRSSSNSRGRSLGHHSLSPCRRSCSRNDCQKHKKELEDALFRLKHMTEERDRSMEMQKSLRLEVESLGKERDELQELLIQEKQKSTSETEKLNSAVRKGKYLAQQRDSLKQNIETITTESGRMKSEIERQKSTITSYEQKFKDICKCLGHLMSNNIFLSHNRRKLIMKKLKLSSFIKTLSRNIDVLFEACAATLKDIVRRKEELLRNDLSIGNSDMTMSKSIGSVSPDQLPHSYSEESVRMIADMLLSAVGDFIDLQAKASDSSIMELQRALANSHKKLDEKDFQKEEVRLELFRQIKEAEAAERKYMHDLEDSENEVQMLKKVIELMYNEREVLEQRLEDMQDSLSISEELKERVRSLMYLLAAKNQENEALMHALDEEELHMEGLTNKIEELEKIMKQKNEEFESVETSHLKLIKKLSTTVTKFDELHHLSETQLTEVEKLQSQLQHWESEISFLRQGIIKCTNGALVAKPQVCRLLKDNGDQVIMYGFKSSASARTVPNFSRRATDMSDGLLGLL